VRVVPGDVGDRFHRSEDARCTRKQDSAAIVTSHRVILAQPCPGITGTGPARMSIPPVEIKLAAAH
jgi:hypothetical protein